EKDEYFVIIRITPSNAAAAAALAKDLSAASPSRGLEIQGVGQEAYLQELNRGARISMVFREENFVVKFLAPSETKGRRLAKYIIDSIAALHTRQEQSQSVMKLSVSDPRPIAEAIKQPQEKYGWIITYEDVRLVNESDLPDERDPKYRQ